MSITATATIRTSNVVTANWAVNTTWALGVIPVAGDTVVIASGANITVAAPAACGAINVVGTLTINTGTTLTVAGGSGSPLTYGTVGGTGTITPSGNTSAIALTGDWSFSGIWTTTTRGSITFNGTGDQTVTGTATWRVIVLNKTSGTLFLTVTPTINTTTTLTAGNVCYNSGGAQSTLLRSGAYPGNLIFSGSGTKTLAIATTVMGTLTVNSGATLAMSTFILTLDGDFVNGGGTTSGSGGVTITGTTTPQTLDGFTTTGNLTFSKASGTATITGNVSAVNLAVSSTTSGVLILSGSNTFSGTRTLTSGTLVLSNTAALGAAATLLTINGGTLDLATDASVNAYNVTVGGAATISSNLATSGPGITHTLGTLSRTNASALTINGGNNVANGTAGITFGAVNHTAAPTYTVTNPTGGGVTQLSLDAVTGGTVLTTMNGNGNVIQTGVWAGTSGITYSGTGTLTLSQANTYTGVTTITSGIVSCNSILSVGGGASALGAPATAANGRIALGATGTLRYTGSGHTSDRVINLSASGGTIDASGSGILTLSGGVTGNARSLNLIGTGNAIESGVIATTTGTVTKNGTGAWTLSGLNTFRGAVTISAGTLSVNTVQNAGTSSSLGTGGATPDISIGATGILQYTGTGHSTIRAIVLTASGGTIDASGSGTLTLSGGVTGNNYDLNLIGSGTGIESGIIGTLTGTVTKNGTGAWTLSGVNTFSGGTTHNAGTLNINNPQALGTVAGTFTIAGGTIDNTSGADITTLNYPLALNANFVYSGTIPRNLNLGTGTVTLSSDLQITVNTGTLTVGGIINDITKSLTKAGAGILAFGSQTITLNSVTISAGSLTSTSSTMNLAGNFSNSGTFTHNSGTVTFNGTGAQTINSGGSSFNNLTIATTGGNASAAAAITLIGNLIINSGSTLDMAGFTSSSFPGSSNDNAGTIRWSGDNVYVRSAGTTGTTEFYNSTAGNVAAGTSYRDLLFTGINKTMNNAITATGNMTINSSASVSVGSVTIQINGNLNNAGSLTNNGTINIGN